jgi:hypothetical protein
MRGSVGTGSNPAAGHSRIGAAGSPSASGRPHFASDGQSDACIHGTQLVPVASESVAQRSDISRQREPAISIDEYRVRLDPQRAGSIEVMMAIHVAYRRACHGLHVRRGVAAFVPDLLGHSRAPDIEIATDYETWLLFCSCRKTLEQLLGAARVERGTEYLLALLLPNRSELGEQRRRRGGLAPDMLSFNFKIVLGRALSRKAMEAPISGLCAEISS